MSEIIYGKGAYRRDNGNLPEFKLVNMYVEATPTTPGGTSLLSFEGLEAIATRGAGPIQGVFQRDGLFNGDTFVVSNNVLYREGVSLGAINSDGPISFAASHIELVVAGGRTAWSYNGTNLIGISFPDGADVTAVAGVIGGLFIFIRDGSDRYYWSAVLDGRTINALDYATAESAPDKLRDVVIVGDNMYLLGEDTIEVWFITGDLNLPLQRISQRTVRMGVIATGCAVEMDNAVHYIGDDRGVYRFSDVPEKISDSGIDERIAQSTTFRVFAFKYQGHNFLCLRLSQGTWSLDAATKGWSERQTYGLSNWVAGFATNTDAGPILGSAVGNDILQFDGNVEGTSRVQRIFTAGFPVESGSVPVDLLEVEGNFGNTGGDEQILQMRFSRNGGDSWSSWREASFGATGEFRKRARFRRLGYFDAPGGLFEFMAEEDAPFRISAVMVNGGASGRSRKGPED